MQDAGVPQLRRPAGRPKRLSVEGIVEAACQIGIEQLDMVTLAEHLNTGVATLYGYVRGRDHILQLVARRMASKALQDVRGDTWEEILRSHAQLCYSNFHSDPELMVSLMEGAKDDAEITYTSQLVSLLTAGGLSHDLAIQAYIGSTQIVIGAALMRLRRQSIDERPTRDRMPISPDQAGNYRPALDRFIRDCSRALSPES